MTASDIDTMNKSIRFLLNGEPVTVKNVDPTLSVLNYLRESLQKIGSKEGCAEGDCGACTVVVGELIDGRLETKAVNACIQFLPTMDSKALFTVEGLRQQDGGLHPVQQAMVDCHGSQCGFCTPGFVMSMWNVYLDHQQAGTQADQQQLRTALTGNLCRCTGYKPILQAGEDMFDLPQVTFDRKTVTNQLQRLQRSESLVYGREGQRFTTPRSMDGLLKLRSENPKATLLAGCTDIGLWVNKQFRELGDIIYIGEVAELKGVKVEKDYLRIGAAVNLTQAYSALTQHYPEAKEMWERFASLPIRNAGTLGGNIANGSPIGDSMPWLIAVGARVVLRSLDGARVMPLEDLYLDYMKKDMRSDEIVEAIEVPFPKSNDQFRTYKLSKRYDSDISAVCAAFNISVEDGLLRNSRIVFGGMAATPERAMQCEAVLNGQQWNESTVRAAMKALKQDYSPLGDMRASADYRMQTTQNLLYRFYLETRPENPLSAERVSVFAEDE